MNQSTKTIQFLTAAAVILVLSSCGNSKSNQVSPNSNLNFSSSNNKVLASCNKSADASASISLAAVMNQAGQPDTNWVKLKFNFLSSQMTASGNTVRFFKWKIMNGQTYPDQTALTSYSFSLSTGQSSPNAMNVVPVSSINGSNGFYINLNDTQGTYQVLKVVVYSSTGQLVGQKDLLIPQFAARTSDYQYNSDGSVRSNILTALHPLAQSNAAQWSDAQLNSYFQAFCF